MRTRKQELISDELKPIVSDLLKNSREKYNYSLEDLSKAINNVLSTLLMISPNASVTIAR